MALVAGGGRAEAQRAPQWTSCGGGFQCVTIKVPSDYNVRNSPVLELALIRQPARDPSRRIGALVVNPGGPGASGFTFVRNWTRSLAPEVQAQFDIVGFDPRGVGASSPLRCHDDIQALAALDPEPVTADEWAVFARAQRAFAELCRTRGGSALRTLGSQNAARDIEAIRTLLGDEQITYLGYSYGTVLGALYANRYPERVRALVLDGPLDMTLEVDELIAQQAQGFELALDRFIDQCTVEECAISAAGRDAATAVAALRDTARRQPIASASADRPASPGEAFLAIVQGLYRPSLWPVLDRALADGLAGDGSGLVRLADRLLGRQGSADYDNSYEMNTAVNCVDYRFAKEPAHYEELARELASVAPRFGPAFAASALVCALWPAPAQPVLPHARAAAGAVTGDRHDVRPGDAVSLGTGDAAAAGVLDAADARGRRAHGVPRREPLHRRHGASLPDRAGTARRRRDLRRGRHAAARGGDAAGGRHATAARAVGAGRRRAAAGHGRARGGGAGERGQRHANGAVGGAVLAGVVAGGACGGDRRVAAVQARGVELR